MKDKKTLSQLLKEWDKQNPDFGLEYEISRLKQKIEMEKAHKKYRDEMDEIIPKVRGDLKISDRFVETWINFQAEQHPECLEIWDKRRRYTRKYPDMISRWADEFRAFCITAGVGKRRAKGL